MQISTAITKKTTFASISKTKNGRTMNFVCIHMFSWAKNTMNVLTLLYYSSSLSASEIEDLLH